MNQGNESELKMSSCCKPHTILTTFNSLSYKEFCSQQKSYLKILKDYSHKKMHDPLIIYYEMNVHRIETREICNNLSSLNYEYILCEGYHEHILITFKILDSNTFTYFPLLNSVGSLISLHTSAVLCLNHITTNKLPLYLKISPRHESKFVRTFLKFTHMEFQYNTIKSRILNIVKHSVICKNNK